MKNSCGVLGGVGRPSKNDMLDTPSSFSTASLDAGTIMTPNKFRLFTLLLLSFFCTALSSLSHATDLLQIYRAALEHDAVISSARATHRAGREKSTQGRALLLPSINLTANTAFNDASTQFPNFSIFPANDARYNTHGYGINLVQPLFRQQNWHAYGIADLQVAQSKEQLKNAEQELILRVAQAYFDVLIAQGNVQSSEAQKAAIIGQLHQAKELFSAGSATITDVYEAQARLDLINAQAIVANSHLATKRTALQQMVNAPLTTLQVPGTPNKLGQQFKLEPPQPPDMQFWLNKAQMNNPLLNIAKISVELAKKDRTRNRDGHFPTLDLVANYAKNFSDAPLGSNNRAASVGVQLNMPLFQGGNTQSKWREAEANYDRIRDDLSVAQRNLTVHTQQAFLGVGSGVAQVQALQQALKSSESLLEASKFGQSAGVRTNLDVLNAQQQLYTTRRDLAQAQYAYLYSLLQLNAAIGALTEEVLAKVNLALY